MAISYYLFDGSNTKAQFRFVFDDEEGTLLIEGTPDRPGCDDYYPFVKLGPGDSMSSAASLGGGLNLTGRWQFNSNPDATPGGQQMSTDTGEAATATELKFATHDKDNFDLTIVLLSLKSGDRILCQQLMNSNNRAVYEVTDTPSDEGSYVSVPVTPVTVLGSGAQWQEVVFAFPLGG